MGGSPNMMSIISFPSQLVFFVLWLCTVKVLSIEKDTSKYIPTDDLNQSIYPANIQTNQIRVINSEELASHNGMIKNNRIWISIFGEVYDVTEGENHYGKGGSYQIFAGRDASPCYITGDFDDEGANVGVHTISNKDLVAIDHWRGFYKDSEEYHQVGVLHGNYYDEFGRPTLLLMQTMERLKLGERELTKIKQERARLRAIRKKNLEATKLREKKLSNKKQEL